MARSIKLLTDEDALHWPRLCARCGATQSLRSIEALVTAARPPHAELSRPLPLGGDVLSLDYPVCRRHARFLSVAQWLTRNALAPRLLRVLSYVLGGMGLLALGLEFVVLPLAGHLVSAGPWTTPPARALEVGAALMLLLPLWAYRVTPVRLTRLENDAVTIRFGSEPYAQAFAQANSKIAVKRSQPTH